MHDEKRAHQRVSFFLLDNGKQPVWSFASKATTTAGILLDISPFGGRLLIHRDRLKNDQKLLIQINQLSDVTASPLQLQAQVLWSRARVATDYCEIGCQFIQPRAEHKLGIMQIITASARTDKPLIVRCELCETASQQQAI